MRPKFQTETQKLNKKTYYIINDSIYLWFKNSIKEIIKKNNNKSKLFCMNSSVD